MEKEEEKKNNVAFEEISVFDVFKKLAVEKKQDQAKFKEYAESIKEDHWIDNLE